MCVHLRAYKNDRTVAMTNRVSDRVRHYLCIGGPDDMRTDVEIQSVIDWFEVGGQHTRRPLFK